MFKEEWQRAMNKEITFLYKNNIWKLVKKLETKRLV